MPKENIIMIVALWLYTIIIILQIIDNKKTVNKLYEEYNSILKQLLEKAKKELALKKIIINSKETKENYFVTLEKIEKELFKQ